MRQWEEFFGSFIPNWIMSNEDLSLGAKLCYGRLAQYAIGSGRAFPRIETLAGELGMGRTSTKDYIRELKEHGLINITYRKADSRSSIYTFPTEHTWMPTASERRKWSKSGKRALGRDSDLGQSGSRPSLGQDSDHPEENHEKEIKEENSLSPGAGGEKNFSAAGPAETSPKEHAAAAPTIVDGADKAKPGLTKAVIEALVDEAGAVSKAAFQEARRKRASAQLKASADKQAKMANLQGKPMSVSKTQQLARCQDIFVGGLRERAPTFDFPPWGPKDKSMCWDLIEKYDGPRIEQALRYLITEWDSINLRLFKKSGGLPTLRVLVKLHDTIVVEAHQYAGYAEVKAEYDKWMKDNPNQFYPPKDVSDRYEKAKKQMASLGAA